MSDSLRPYGLYFTRLLCPWNFPGKNMKVGLHFLVQEMFSTQGLDLRLLHCRGDFSGCNYRLRIPKKTRSSGCRLVTKSCLTLWDPMDSSPPGSSVHGNSLGKNTGVGCHFLLQGIFLAQGLNPCLLHCRWLFLFLTTEQC